MDIISEINSFPFLSSSWTFLPPPQLDQPELGLPGREYFINPGDYQYREAYLNLMLSVTQLLGAPLDVALHDMTEVLHFEKEVSRVGASRPHTASVTDGSANIEI